MTLFQTISSVGKTSFTPFPIAKLSVNSENIDKRALLILSSDGRIVSLSAYIKEDYARRHPIAPYLSEFPIQITDLDSRVKAGRYKFQDSDLNGILPNGDILVESGLTDLRLKGDGNQMQLLRAFQRPVFTRVQDLYDWELGTIQQLGDLITDSTFKLSLLESLVIRSGLNIPLKQEEQDNSQRIHQLEKVYRDNPLQFARISYK